MTAERSPGEIAAPAAAEAAETEIATVTLSTGIELRLRPVPPRILRDAQTRVPKPQVPIVHIVDRGRDEPNPDDPQYQSDLDKWVTDTSDAAFKVGLILGTVVERVPEGYYRPEDDQWIDLIEGAYEVDGLPSPVRRTPEKARYLDWLLYYALGNREDEFKLTWALYRAFTPTKEALHEAMESFRRLTGGRVDLGGSGDSGSQ